MSVIKKDVVGYEGLYEVSSKGEVFGLPKVVKGNHLSATRSIPARLVKQHMVAGYPAVSLSKNGKAKMFKVHRLVGEAFIPNPDNLPIMNHLDNDRSNNDVSNLEWTTFQGNMDHKVRQGRQARNYGEASGSAKVTKLQVDAIRKLSGIMSQKAIGHRFGISQQQVSRIIRAERWPHIPSGVAGSKDHDECVACA